MELLLRVHGRDDVCDDVRVDIDGRAPVAALAHELAAHLGQRVSNGQTPALVRAATGERLDPGGSIADSGVVSGDVLLVAAPPRPVEGTPPAASFAHVGERSIVLDVLGGPEAGRSVVLPAGPSRLGRGHDCDIVIADPTVSRHHLTLSVRPGEPVRILPEPSAANQVFVDGARAPDPVDAGEGSVIQAGATILVIRHLIRSEDSPQDRLGQVPFHRTPFRPSLVMEREFEALGDIPAEPEPRRFTLLSALAPLAGGVVLFAFSRQAQFLALTLLTPLAVAANWFEDRRAGRRRFERDAARFREATRRRREEVDAALRAERLERFDAAPDVADLGRRAQLRTTGLWPRGRDTEELFLALRVGLGDVASKVRAPVAAQGDAGLRAEALASLAGHDKLHSVPVVVELAALGTLAVHGDDVLVDTVAASLVVQAAALHSPEDLVMLAAVDPNRGLAQQLKWLPQTRTLTSPVSGAHVVSDTTAAQALCDALVEVAQGRTAVSDRARDQRWPWLLVVLDEALEVNPATVSQLLDHAPGAGIGVVWLARSAARIPRQAAAVLRCRPTSIGPSQLWFRDPQRHAGRLELEAVQLSVADRVMRSLAPLRDASAASATTAIPRVVPLLAPLGLDLLSSAPDDPTRQDASDGLTGTGAVTTLATRLGERWLADRQYSLTTPLGFSAEGVMSMDLVSSGPHAVIGGTTGSGKSELLVALVAGLIANHPPKRLNLLFIDYKGGAASAVFKRAPHTVGYVTNLNADLAARTLVSLRAERDRRMRLLEGRAKDLEEMLDRHPAEAPASLVIVVDEFATLVTEVPGFVPGIVDIAQVGRSLGIHLVLATQRPSGAVNDDILANVTIRVSLRMLDVSESTAILGTGDAAAIPAPLKGRAFASFGPGAPTEFQSSFSRAPARSEEALRVDVETFGTSGERRRRHPRPTKRVAPVVESATQLDVLLDAVDEAADKLGMPKPRPPWHDELSSHIALDHVLQQFPAASSGWTLPIGMLDDPERQRQGRADVDLEEGGGLVVYGAAGAGKTTVLRTIAVAATTTETAEGVVIYALDFASRALRALDALGAVVATGDDLEAVTRLLAVLDTEVKRRRSLVAEAGAETLSAYLRTSPGAVPRVVVLVDGYTAMRDTFQGEASTAAMQGWLERFHRIVSEGRTVGIHTVVTADRSGAVPPMLSAAIARRLILRQVDERALTELGVPATRGRGLELGPGRGLLDGQLVVQVACVADTGDAAAQAKEIRAVGQRRTTVVPRELQTAPLAESVAMPTVAGLHTRQAVLGVADVTGAPVVVDLDKGHLIVLGPPRSGRSSTLAALALSLGARSTEVYLVGAASSPLRGLSADGRGAFGGGGELGALAEELEQLTTAFPDAHRVLFVDDAEAVLEEAGPGGPLDALARCRGLSVVAALDTRSAISGYSPSPLLAELKAVRRRFLLQPGDDGEIHAVLQVRARLRPGLVMPPGRGVLLADREPVVVQVADPAALEESDGPGGNRARAARSSP